MVNLVAAEGDPPEVMAPSFANRLLSILYVAKNHSTMEPKVYGVPENIANDIAGYALDEMSIARDEMTKEQRRYQNSS